MLKRIIVILTLFLAPVLALAGEVKFSLSVSATRISTQDYLQVQYVIENGRKISQFIPPTFRNFTIMEGPDQTSGFNMENGNLTEYTSFSYLLKPVREGRMIIPAATAKIDGKIYKSNTVVVEVSGAVIPGTMEDQAMLNELVLKKGETVEGKIRNNIFVKLDVDRRTCYVGEPVVATYKLYTRLRSESKVSKRPSFNGFSVYDMANPETGESEREIYQGRDYNVYLLRKVQLYPLQSGSLELEPAEVENNISFIKGEALGSGYAINDILKELSDENNTSGAVVREKVVLQSEPVQINVKPLPETKDMDFAGAVGKFNIRSFIEETDIHQNDVLNLHVQLSGKGNFPMITAPSIQWPGVTDVFEPTSAEEYNRFVSPLTGSKRFSYPFTVKKEGDVIIPAVEFHYFDTEKGGYVTLRTDSIRFHVQPARKMADSGTVVRTEQPANAWKWILSGLGLIAVFGGMYILLKRNEQPATVKSQGDADIQPVLSPEEKRDPLEQIRQAFDKGDAREFYRQLAIVIDECMMSKYQVDAKQNWKEGLLQKGISMEQIDEIAMLKEDAAMAIYTPFVMESKMVEDLARIERIIC